VWGACTTAYVGAHYERNINSGQVTRYYYLGGQRIAQRRAGVVYYLHTDHLGSASLTTDASGNRVGELRYKPYGETRYIWGVTRTDRRYTGQREEAGLGLYDYGARFYDPLLGRFLSADSIVPQAGNPQTLNRYSYVLNSPLNYRDPSGHTPIDICTATHGNAPGCGNGPVYGGSTLLRFSGDWGLAHRDAVVRGAEALASRMYMAIRTDRQRAYAVAPRLGGDPSAYSAASHLWGLSQDELFLTVAGGQVPFSRVSDGDIPGMWAASNQDGWVQGSNLPAWFRAACLAGNICYDASVFTRGTTAFNDVGGHTQLELNAVHELTHWIDHRGGRDARAHLADSWDIVPLQRNAGGWAGNFPGWQQSNDPGEGEVFADMGVGWTYGNWAGDSHGAARSRYMEANMPGFAALAVAGN